MQLKYHHNKIYRQLIDVMTLAESGCAASVLSLAISDLRQLVSDFAFDARETRKEAK